MRPIGSYKKIALRVRKVEEIWYKLIQFERKNMFWHFQFEIKVIISHQGNKQLKGTHWTHFDQIEDVLKKDKER